MLIMTAKLPRRKLKIGLIAAVLFCCCGVIGFQMRGDSAQAAASATPDPTGISNEEDRITYLHGWGWQVEEEAVTAEELLIPEVMDEGYDQYLALQKEQGFDLSKYAGKRIKRYTYHITNYPGGIGDVVVNLLIYRDTVIGGEVLSPQLDGFLHGLAMP